MSKNRYQIPTDLTKLYLTIKTPEGFSTFARDNAEHFEPWMNLQFAKLNNRERKWDSIVMIQREFKGQKDAKTGFPIKHISACIYKPGGVCLPMKAAEIQEASSYDHATGKMLEPEPDVVYVDFKIPYLN